MGTLDGKVAFITGAARGQGRSHAVKLASEGADIIALDLCDQVATVSYPMSTPEDLAETARLVEKEGRRIVTHVGDVRVPADIEAALAKGVEELGRLDIVVANAGVMFHGSPKDKDVEAFQDAIDIMLIGVWHTVRLSAPYLVDQGEGGSIVITSSTAGLKANVAGTHGGNFGYNAAKHGVVGTMRMYANILAPHSIRVNTVHPTGVDTPMLVGFHEWVAEQPVSLMKEGMGNLLPGVPVIQPEDVSNAIAWLVSDAARYVTGITLPVDAGMLVK
jgi:SDR family mycofactocin-dependent oxidoreductase